MGFILGVLLGAASGVGGSALLCLWLQHYRDTRPLVVNGLRVPAALVQAVQQRGRVWAPRDGVYPFGARWKRHLQLSLDERSLAKSSEWLDPFGAESQRFLHGSDAWEIDPGFIPYITDFSQILDCGIETLVRPVCLDFRDSPLEPSVIYWTGTYWRRIAPSVDAFITMIEPWDDQKHGRPRQPTEAERLEADAIVLALVEASRYDTWDTSMLIDVVYPADQSPTVVLFPLEGRFAEDRVKPDQQIRVAFPPGAVIDPSHPQEGRAAVMTSCALEALHPGTPKALLGQAVASALRYQSSQRGCIGQPGIIRVGKRSPVREGERQGGYFVHYTASLPEVISGHISFCVSEDLTEVFRP